MFASTPPKSLVRSRHRKTWTSCSVCAEGLALALDIEVGRFVYLFILSHFSPPFLDVHCFCCYSCQLDLYFVHDSYSMIFQNWNV